MLDCCQQVLKLNRNFQVNCRSCKVQAQKNQAICTLADDELGIREKYAPYDPQMRPWLVIIEVNMTDPELNTECTGKLFARSLLDI